MAEALKNSICFVGIDVGKNSFHVVGLDGGGAIVLRQKWSRGQVAARFANMPPCLIGMEACVGAHRDGDALRVAELAGEIEGFDRTLLRHLEDEEDLIIPLILERTRDDPNFRWELQCQERR